MLLKVKINSFLTETTSKPHMNKYADDVRMCSTESDLSIFYHLFGLTVLTHVCIVFMGFCTRSYRSKYFCVWKHITFVVRDVFGPSHFVSAVISVCVILPIADVICAFSSGQLSCTAAFFRFFQFFPLPL